MTDLTNYVVKLNGTDSVVQLSPEDVKRYKDGGVELKEYKAPANKAADKTAATK